MRVEWLVVKYMHDLRRREPVNVGVILHTDGTSTFRFLGQRSDGQIDGRRIKWAGSVRTYKAWVEYWKRTLATSEADVDALLKLVPSSNYLVEYGGERLLGTGDLDPSSFLDSLFGILVAQGPERTTLNVEQLSESVLNQVGIADRVQRRAKFEVVSGSGALDSVYFDYRFDNGAVNLMQRLNLIYDDERSWDVAHAGAWTFDKAAHLHLEGGRTRQLVALVKHRDMDAELRRQLGVLHETTNLVVNVGEQDRAASKLAEVLGVADNPAIL